MCVLSHVWLFASPWTIASQAPLSMRFPRQEHWSGLPLLSPGGLPNPGIEPTSPALAGGIFTTEPHGDPDKEVCAQSFQLCPTLCDPVYCSPQGSSVHGILLARILEWVAISSSRGSSQPRDRTWVSWRSFYCWATGGMHVCIYVHRKSLKG